MSRPDEKQTGLLRLSAILAPNGPIPVSRSSWHRGVADGRFPRPVHLGPRITCWRAEDIEALVAKGIKSDGAYK
mgnify:CR=1 FL=1